MQMCVGDLLVTSRMEDTTGSAIRASDLEMFHRRRALVSASSATVETRITNASIGGGDASSSSLSSATCVEKGTTILTWSRWPRRSMRAGGGAGIASSMVMMMASMKPKKRWRVLLVAALLLPHLHAGIVWSGQNVSSRRRERREALLGLLSDLDLKHTMSRPIVRGSIGFGAVIGLGYIIMKGKASVTATFATSSDQSQPLLPPASTPTEQQFYDVGVSQRSFS